MQNWQKLMHFEHENGLKPLFGPNWPILGPRKFFSALSPALAARYHNSLSKHTNWQKLRHLEQENG